MGRPPPRRLALVAVLAAVATFVHNLAGSPLFHGVTRSALVSGPSSGGVGAGAVTAARDAAAQAAPRDGAEEHIHLHIVPHSHVDPGWLRTLDEYQAQFVDKILKSVLVELALDPAR